MKYREQSSAINKAIAVAIDRFSCGTNPAIGGLFEKCESHFSSWEKFAKTKFKAMLCKNIISIISLRQSCAKSQTKLEQTLKV